MLLIIHIKSSLQKNTLLTQIFKLVVNVQHSKEDAREVIHVLFCGGLSPPLRGPAPDPVRFEYFFFRGEAPHPAHP